MLFARAFARLIIVLFVKLPIALITSPWTSLATKLKGIRRRSTYMGYIRYAVHQLRPGASTNDTIHSLSACDEEFRLFAGHETMRN